MLRRTMLLVPVLLAACGGGGDGSDVAATTSTTAAPDAPVTATVDWGDRVLSIDGSGAFDVAFCDGEAPLLCISRDGAALGVVELLTAEGEVSDFGTWASDFYDSMAADRTEGCDPGYTLEGQKPEVATFAGALGVRYGFVGTTGGHPVERVLGYAINDGGLLRLLVANALADDACLAREAELPLEVMDDLEPVLAAIAAGSRF